jgi:hypothetical protein
MYKKLRKLMPWPRDKRLSKLLRVIDNHVLRGGPLEDVYEEMMTVRSARKMVPYSHWVATNSLALYVVGSPRQQKYRIQQIKESYHEFCGSKRETV